MSKGFNGSYLNIKSAVLLGAALLLFDPVKLHFQIWHETSKTLRRFVKLLANTASSP